MKNDKYYGSLRSRDNQWGEVESIQKGTLLSLLIYILLKVCFRGVLIDHRPDRHFWNWFLTRPAAWQVFT